MILIKPAFIASALYGISSAALLYQRGVSNTPLYAYGIENLSGAPVIYGDGLAWIGFEVPSWLSVATNVTFSTSGFNTTSAWSAHSNDSSFPSTAPVLYIIPTSGSFEQVGFVGSNETVPTGAVTTGFTFFGSSVAYAANPSNYELQFWAQETNTTGIYALVWNSDGSAEDGSVPVTLKSMAPPSISA